jgi:hypothetical protein
MGGRAVGVSSFQLLSRELPDLGEMQQEGEKSGRFGDCSEKVIGACIEVHRWLGSGLRESPVGDFAASSAYGQDALRRGLRRLTLNPKTLPAFSPVVVKWETRFFRETAKLIPSFSTQLSWTRPVRVALGAAS